MPNNNYKIQIENRLAILETKVEEIILNHLPHLEEKLDRQQWFAITTLVGIIIILLFK